MTRTSLALPPPIEICVVCKTRKAAIEKFSRVQKAASSSRDSSGACDGAIIKSDRFQISSRISSRIALTWITNSASSSGCAFVIKLGSVWRNCLRAWSRIFSIVERLPRSRASLATASHSSKDHPRRLFGNTASACVSDAPAAGFEFARTDGFKPTGSGQFCPKSRGFSLALPVRNLFTDGDFARFFELSSFLYASNNRLSCSCVFD